MVSLSTLLPNWTFPFCRALPTLLLMSWYHFVICHDMDMSLRLRFELFTVGETQVFRSLLGFSFPLFGQQMYNRLGLGYGNTVSPRFTREVRHKY